MRFASLLISLMIGGVVALNATANGVPFLFVALIYAVFSVSVALVAALIGQVPRPAGQGPFVRLDSTPRRAAATGERIRSHGSLRR
ncbi:hypothetical protein [Aliiroseovarius sp.]|uniref:hypothetical protein n=1 Tax=Aliiroseovarius sp. TaxID=1872442 RepID=UPI002638FC15|nr:hypothetical protein [Aliiroseovarius sp.]